MNVNNNAKRATIAEIQGNFFEIPPYQRLYEWEKEQIETLLDDMKKAFETNKEKEYFIGNITTSIKSKNEQKIYVLIDGQQRLTTLWFIGFYLASQNCPNWKEFIMQGENLRIAMPIRDNEENALTKLAKNINGKENLAQSLQGYGVYQNIIDAFKCIESWFVNGNGKNIDLANFAKYIYENICFVFVTLAQNTDLNRFFVRMNNRGKQLEKHEILKARMLGEIRKVYDKNGELRQDENDEIWQKYAKIWDLCSDMDKYIFQSASDRSIFAPKSQDNNGTKFINDNDSLVKLADIVEKYKIHEANESKEKDSPSKVESIIDFPTFLLHCYKLWVAKKCKYKIEKITITQDKLLEIMWDNKVKNEEIICCKDFIFNGKDSSNAKQNCKKFIIFMLQIRVLFDYFVIKNNKKLIEKGKNPYAIKRLDKDNNGYYSVADSNVLEKLAMIQNYLRVARQGERQNYHHWLTPFLKFLDKHIRLDMNLTLDKNKEFDFDNFKDNNAEKIAKLFENNTSNKYFTESNAIEFLENLDTKLAIVQLNKTSENDLLDATNKVLQDLHKVNESHNLDTADWDFLNHGTGTPHYWFYRLEYYLWKWGNQKNEINNNEIKNIFTEFDRLEFPKGDTFKKILNAFYFRNLNSVEHIEPQSKAENGVNEWKIYKDDKGNITKRDIDCFGNLALLSVGFNSSLSNQDNADKRLDLQKKINKSEVESLKLWLVYVQYIKDGDKWTCGNAQEHQKQMIAILIKSLNSKSK